MKDVLEKNLLIAIVFCAVHFFSCPPTAHAAVYMFGDVSPALPSLWNINTTGWIGRSSVGQVIVDGGSVLQDYGCSLGANYGANGTVLVTGAGSTWTNKMLYIGSNGNGAMNVEAGGKVTSGTAHLGYIIGSNGTATVTGAGSTWTQSGSVYVGDNGSGTLNIEAGGKVSNVTGYIGYNSGSSGSVTVTGVGSSWSQNGSLYVGNYGSGTMNIEAEGKVNNGTGYIGCNSGSIGSVTVTGMGSSWTNNNLYVGTSGSGTLTVADGGTVTVNNDIYASLNSLFGNGTISINGVVIDADLIFDATHGLQQTMAYGTGGKFNINRKGGVLGLGYKGNGTLRIADGIAVPSSTGYLGYNSGSTGTATVNGTGSTWTSNNLYVGYSGTGILNIEAGGHVTNLNNTTSYLGYNSGATGTVIISGVGSSLESYGLTVSNGTLNIGGNNVSGGLVKTRSLILSNSSSNTGTCNINNGGTLQVLYVNQGSGIANFNWNDGTIQNYSSYESLTISSKLVLKLAATGTHAFKIDSGRTGTVDAILSDATTNGTLNKTGTGTLTLTGANTYSGRTTVEAGRFKVTGSILNTNGVTVNELATLELASTAGSATAANLAISNSGTLLISAGSQTVGAITGTGITKVNAGTSLTAQSIFQGSLIIGSSGVGTSMADVSTVPEPGAMILLAFGLMGLAAVAWRS